MEHHFWLTHHYRLPNDGSDHDVLTYVPIDHIIYIVIVFHDDMIWLYVQSHHSRVNDFL